jgi:nicotinate phosphoribosyltransferase
MASRGYSLGLFTAFYELTMAQAYWQSGQTAEAAFSLFLRRYPLNRGYLVFAGLPDVLDYLEDFGFTDDDVAYLRSLGRFDPAFLGYLRTLRFTGTVRAMAEGTIFFANEPVIEVTAPIIQAQILENYLLNRVNLQTMLATKAARVVHAAQGRTVTEFASRRTQGLDAAQQLARLGYMTGFAGTGNVLAAANYGVPPSGTMAHSFVTSYPTEAEAFRAYSRSFPDRSIFLVDSYDTIEGTKNAIRVAREMRASGHELQAIRLDSGDFADLSRRARALLDEAGFSNVQIVISGELDEFEIQALLEAGAPIDGFGVGTRVGASVDAPWTDCVYKLVEYDGKPVLKLSTGKETLAGRKQVYRHRDADGRYLRDIIALADDPPPPGHMEPLLQEVMRGGVRTRDLPTLEELRSRFAREFPSLPDQHKALQSPAPYMVSISTELERLQQRLTREIKQRILAAD